MIKHIIEVRLNNVSREEQQELKEYLEANCWGWEEKETYDHPVLTPDKEIDGGGE